MGNKRKPNYLTLSFYFTLIGNGTVLRLQLDTHTALPLLAWSVNSHFQVFLRSARKEPANCSFTPALIGGKLFFPVFLRCEWRKTGICSFTAALIGGKIYFPVFLRYEGGKPKMRVHMAEVFHSDFLILFFPYFACWWVIGRGLVPQNEGWKCLNNNWVK